MPRKTHAHAEPVEARRMVMHLIEETTQPIWLQARKARSILPHHGAGKMDPLNSQTKCSTSSWGCCNGRLASLTVAAGEVDCFGGEAIFRDAALAGYVTSGGYGHRVGASLALVMSAASTTAPRPSSRSSSWA